MALRRYLLVATALILSVPAAAQPALLFDGDRLTPVVHDGATPTRLAAELLARDLHALTGRDATVSADLAACGTSCIVVGTVDSPLVRAVAADTGADLAELGGGWERYARMALRSRRHPGRRYLLIAGSDRRGSIWGVVDLTRDLGISAWEWWADVTPRRRSRLTVDGRRRVSASPSVRYRGVFLNDEDWGLQPWAAKTHEPEVGDIGPRTYARVFELLWRLKANLIWPAMHDSTKPFYQIAGNAEAARDHAIVVGTSHAEPMMRNNVREWDDKLRGPFNFLTNRTAMVDYWRERAEAVKGFENIYSIGLRGKHDSAMEGADTPEAARKATAEAIAVQRDLLAAAQDRPAAQVPQALTLYKEVLDVYAGGLAVPDDVTLVWPEDNYGYINRLPTEIEAARSGGAGVYYHISYWGRPHDYLWLATTHPALIREQMQRAAALRANRLWVVNVGDIKPGEYLTQYFLDLAFDHGAFAQAPRDHLRDWAAVQFGPAAAPEVAAILTAYYDLAWERRPEFMGFNSVEPTAPVNPSAYVRSGGAEAERRLDRYAALVARAEALGATLPADRRDAYFELVLYPVRGAASLNQRILDFDLAAVHGQAIRAPAFAGTERVAGVRRADMQFLTDAATAAQDRIAADAAAYDALAGGKWRGMMHPAPRGLPVFQPPAWPRWTAPALPGCGIEAIDLAFVAGQPAARGFTLYSAGQVQDWTWRGASGRLDAGNGYRARLTLRYDGSGKLDAGTVRCGTHAIAIPVRLAAPAKDAPAEVNRIMTLAAIPGTEWEAVPGLGSGGTALRSRLDLPSGTRADAMPLDYRFALGAVAGAELRIVAVPTHPLTAANGLRIAVSIDGRPSTPLDFRTHGRSDEWKRNVLSNTAIRSISLAPMAAGAHSVRIVALDPGVVLDRVELRLDGAPDDYGAPLR